MYRPVGVEAVGLLEVEVSRPFCIAESRVIKAACDAFWDSRPRLSNAWYAIPRGVCKDGMFASKDGGQE